jgi:hypothetical protein
MLPASLRHFSLTRSARMEGIRFRFACAASETERYECRCVGNRKGAMREYERDAEGPKEL